MAVDQQSHGLDMTEVLEENSSLLHPNDGPGNSSYFTTQVNHEIEVDDEFRLQDPYQGGSDDSLGDPYAHDKNPTRVDQETQTPTYPWWWPQSSDEENEDEQNESTEQYRPTPSSFWGNDNYYEPPEFLLFDRTAEWLSVNDLIEE